MSVQAGMNGIAQGVRLVLGLATASLAAAAVAGQRPVQSVSSLDPSRYAGKWFEIALYPNRFEKRCASDVSAEYTLLPDGRIRVVNSCRVADGSMTRAEVIARLARRGGPSSQLKVRFAPVLLSFIPAVWGDYWVIGLAADYSYAVVGAPSREYLWILSRTPTLDADLYQKAIETAVSNGFDPSRLVPTKQTQ
jgi:apolipoprotein D and lipocalin family protein